MSGHPPWSDTMDEAYWHAVVSQGRWADGPALPATFTVEHDGPPEPHISADEMDGRWEALDTLFADGTVLCLTVTGYNKGGLLVNWEGMQGFVPLSQLMDAPVEAGECARMDYLASLVGEELSVKVIELDRAQNRIIFSQRAARWGKCCPDSLLASLRAGDICEGVVSNLCDFGVFVDLGGIDGLVHVSELSWRRVQHPRDVLHVGQGIKVYVIDVDHQRRRIALSLKRLQPNPWASVATRYRPGMVVAGVVTNVVEFGAFARIEDGVEGLIHVSEMTGDPEADAHPGEIVGEGAAVRVRILSVDSENQRMALSLRGIDEPADAASGYTDTLNLSTAMREMHETDSY